ncbi:hypothetical protein ACROYT_G028449 [Oculina patagonica]
MESDNKEIEGVLKFTLEPSDPSYARKGSNARLVWDYSVDDKQKELQGIVYSVQVSNGPSVYVLVQFKNGTVVEHPQLPAAYKGRVRIEGNASLIIENVSLQDNTRFMCRLYAEPGAGQDHLSIVQLIVTELPVISPPIINGSYIEGSSVNISCTATGKPIPEVSWMRNGQIKSFGRKTAYLNFDRITRTDDGMYTCRANNPAGTKTHIETLLVRYPAKILRITTSAASSWIGQTVLLKCVSDGVPTPTLTWYKPDGNELNTVTAKESTVKVTINDEQDFGKYKCVAFNGLDPSNSASMLLRHKSIPETPDIINMPAEVQSDEVTLKWTKPVSNGADITQYTVYMRNVSSNGTVGDWRKFEVIHDVSVREYVVTLKKGRRYEFVVTATNKYGESLKEEQNIKRIKVLGGKVMEMSHFLLQII